MSRSRRRLFRPDLFVRFALEYAGEGDQPAEFVIPEDLSALSDEELAALHAQAVSNFDEIYADGSALSEQDLDALGVLTGGIESIAAEMSTRAAAAADRSAAAAEMASRVHTEERSETIEDVTDESSESESESEGAGDEGTEGDGQPEGAEPVAVVAGGPTPGAVPRRTGDIRVNVAGLRSRRPSMSTQRTSSEPSSMRDLVYAAGDGTGFSSGQGVDWDDIGRIVDRRLMGYSAAQYAAAARAGQHLTQQHSVAMLRRPIPEDLIVQSNDQAHVEEVMGRATDQSRLQGGSLVASGGWCAPSEILYDFLELESRDGLVSLPEIGVSRGGIQWTTGIDYSTIYNAIGWSYTEAQDEAGTYAVTDDADHLHPGSGSAGSKPCYAVECPSFDEARLDLAGLCLQSGLLQQRGFPEILARTSRGAMVAHEHKMSIRKINLLVAGSTAVTMTTGTVGTLAPLLSAIEMQVEHYRYIHRLARGTVLEAIFPYWVHGAIRTDIALRQGLTPQESLQVSDAQINTWFASRGIAPQFVYDWQPLTGTAANFTTWPSTVDFLLYVAGTWVVGASDVITLDTIYDSTLLGDNDFTALFTEEGYLVAKRWIDSRVITVPICSNGGTGAPIQLGCDGTAQNVDITVPVAGTLAVSNEASTTFDLTISGASDAGVGLHAAPYRFTTDAQSTTPTWTAWQAAVLYQPSGLTASTTYHCQHQVRDVNGNIVTGAAVDGTTTA